MFRSLSNYLNNMSGWDWTTTICSIVVVFISTTILIIEHQKKTPNKKTFAYITLISGIILAIGNCNASKDNNLKTDKLLNANSKIDSLSQINIKLSFINSSKIDSNLEKLNNIIDSSAQVLNSLRIEHENILKNYALNEREHKRSQFPIPSKIRINFEVDLDINQDISMIEKKLTYKNSMHSSGDSNIMVIPDIINPYDTILQQLQSIGNMGYVSANIIFLNKEKNWILIAQDKITSPLKNWQIISFETQSDNYFYQNFPNYYIQFNKSKKTFTLKGERVYMDLSKRNPATSLYDIENSTLRVAIFIQSSNLIFFYTKNLTITFTGPNETYFTANNLKRISQNSGVSVFEQRIKYNIWQ